MALEWHEGNRSLCATFAIWVVVLLEPLEELAHQGIPIGPLGEETPPWLSRCSTCCRPSTPRCDIHAFCLPVVGLGPLCRGQFVLKPSKTYRRHVVLNKLLCSADTAFRAPMFCARGTSPKDFGKGSRFASSRSACSRSWRGTHVRILGRDECRPAYVVSPLFHVATASRYSAPAPTWVRRARPAPAEPRS